MARATGSTRTLSSSLRHGAASLLAAATHPHQNQQRRGAMAKVRPIEKVRLKWVKNRGLDHIIDRDTDVKAACLLKDAIKRSPSGYLTARTLSPLQKTLGLTIPVLRFLRRYPTLFSESPDPRYPSLPTFRLTDTALLLDSREADVHLDRRQDAADRLTRLLMMSNSRALPLKSIIPLKYDLGLPDDFHSSLVPHFPERLRLARRNGLPYLELANWQDDLAISAVQRMNERAISDPGHRDFRRSSPSRAFLVFPMSFPRGYGGMKKVRRWMEEFDKLPYISPYDDVSGVHAESEVMEKHVVGVLHELLSLTIHKKTKRNYLRCLREEMNLPQKFTRVFTRYPGVYYLSLKCKTTTVVLREGYRRGKLVEPHPLALVRDRYYYVMRTGVMYRGKGSERLVLGEGEDQSNGDTGESDDEEYCEGTASEDDDETGSDE